MREKRIFAQRTRVLQSDEVKRKYFLVYEGKSTERIYFEAVETNKQKIGINPLIELVPVIRSYSEENWSNPKKIIDRVLQNLREYETNIISYETLLNWIMDYFRDNKILMPYGISERIIWQKLMNICQLILKVSLNDNIIDIENNCKKILHYLAKELNIDSLINNFSDIIKSSTITYSEGFDKICFIIDRDKDSFTSEQYQYVLAKCQENNFGFYLSNPCFEFWLLLHFNNVFDLDKSKLLENIKVSSSKRYAEAELSKIFCGFKKSKYDATILLERIDTAISNEKYFCEDVVLLEDNIGSRVGLLIKELSVKYTS